MKYKILIIALILLLPQVAQARIEMVTLPEMGEYQLTIYNSEDITLVRDERELTFKKGINRIEFSWAGTLIDPSSVVFLPKEYKDKIEILDTSFPPNIGNTLVWNINSDVSGKVPVEISYFTSGISWKADYFLVMDSEEKNARFEGYVNVHNKSGEDYEKSQVRLVVGKIHLVENIRDLAGGILEKKGVRKYDKMKLRKRFSKKSRRTDSFSLNSLGGAAPKEIKKEGLSEYFIYTVEGRETIKNKWSKRLPSFNIEAIPVKSLFKHEDYRLGSEAVRYVTFKNDKTHKMGTEPIPDGNLRVLKKDGTGNLQYLGSSNQKYIPKDGTIEVNLGADPEVKTEIELLDYKIENHSFDHTGNIEGWDTVSTYRIKIRNFKSSPIRMAMKRRLNGKFKITTDQKYLKEDYRTVKFDFNVKNNSDFVFTYSVRNLHGTNAE